jgi:hypothetical protein
MQNNDVLYSNVKNNLNARLFPGTREVNKLPSKTVPDQALDLKEIIRRFAAGIPMNIGKMPVFDEENDLPDFTKMDLADRQEYAEQFKEELATMAGRIPPKPPAQEKQKPDATTPGEG